MGSVTDVPSSAADYSRFFHAFMNVHPSLATTGSHHLPPHPHHSMTNHHSLPPLHPHHHHHPRWRFFAVPNRSFWTKYCLLCTICGSAATILAAIFLVVAALFRYYTTSIYYFETVPTYIPAILLSICGVSTIAFSCKRNRNIILLRITACWSLVSAALSSVITITTSLIHMNRLQTLRECVYNGKPNPPSCTCIAHTLNIDSIGNGYEPVHYVFENTPDCDVIHGTLYSCLRAVFAISVVAVLLSIFLCMLLYQLIGHERKKAYWSRIRRINSDWSADFIACLARPMPRERSSMMPLVMSPTAVSLPMSMSNGTTMMPPQGLYGWEPPPPYEGLMCQGNEELAPNNNGSSGNSTHPTSAPPGPPPTFVAIPPANHHHSLSISNNNKPPDSFGAETQFPIINANSFSPTITSMDPPQLVNRSTIPPSQQQQRYNEISNNTDNAPPGTVTTPSEIPPARMATKTGKNIVRQSSSEHSKQNSYDLAEDSSSPEKRIRFGRTKLNKAINSLPNSPILMNVRRFCSFSSGDERGKRKKSVSVAKLDHDSRSGGDGDCLLVRDNLADLSQQHCPVYPINYSGADSSHKFSDCSEDEELHRL